MLHSFAVKLFFIGLLSTALALSVDNRRIGVMITKQSIMFEQEAAVKLAVQLINNHSDGWYDDLDLVHMIYNVSEYICTFSIGENVVRAFDTWAKSSGGRLDGISGAGCSDASKGAAVVGGTEVFAVQISGGATNTDLTFAKHVSE